MHTAEAAMIQSSGNASALKVDVARTFGCAICNIPVPHPKAKAAKLPTFDARQSAQPQAKAALGDTTETMKARAGYSTRLRMAIRQAYHNQPQILRHRSFRHGCWPVLRALAMSLNLGLELVGSLWKAQVRI
jgi:hypothetical protein